MSLIFPASPASGDMWPSPPAIGLPVWTWDGSEWIIGPLMVSAVRVPTYYIYGF